MSTNDTRNQESAAAELTVKEVAGDCETIETDDEWEGPFPEYDKYGNLTGCSYVRCNSCGIEVLTGRKDFASHRDRCRFKQ